MLGDPEGAELRIWQPRRRLGAQAVNVPGTWNFSDLRTTDAKAAMAFYAGAVMRDPQGADFTASQFTPPSG